MRHISFSLTTAQIKARSKTVTRRHGWLFAKPGMLLQAVEKAQGLKLGEKVSKLAVIRVTDVRREPLRQLETDLAYGCVETTREGFPAGTDLHFPPAFIRFFLASHKGLRADDRVTRIEFEYVDG